jgi:predicted pyridoxine 5'-phosphate oxidase superfamily flavin-nucleotide-binding protein
VLEDRTVPTTILWTGDGGTSNWDAHRNWNLDRVPIAGDDVVISSSFAGITITHSQAFADVCNSIDTFAAIKINAGSLNVAAASTFRDALTVSALNSTTLGTLTLSADSTVGGAFNLAGGTLSGSGNLTITGLVTWTGGTMSGSGHTVANGSMTLGTGGIGTKTLSGRTVDNSGTATWTGGDIDANDGSTWNNPGGNTFDAQSNNAFTFTSGTAPVFSSTGTVKKTAGTGITRFDGTFTTTGTLNPQVGTLSLNNPFTNASTVFIEPGATLAVTGDYTQTAGTTVVDGNLSPTGNVSIQGGLLQGSGTINANVTNAATTGPGDSPGVLTIVGNYTQSAAGTLAIELGGTNAGQDYDQFAVTGTATLDGTLSVQLINGFQPSAGESFQFLTYASSSGTFATVNGLDLGNGKRLRLDYNPSDAALTVVRTVSAEGTTISGVEAKSFNQVVATFTSSDSAAQASQFSATIDWGDGQTTAGAITADPSGGFDVSGTHTYADEGTDSITVTVTDNQGGGSDTANSTANISDAALTPLPLTFHPKEGLSGTGIVGNFRDANPNGSASEFTASIDWGDGSTTSGNVAPNGAGGFKVTGTHTYTEEGSFPVAVAVSDDGGSTTTVMSTAAVADAPLIPAPVTIHPKEGVSFSGVVGNFRDANANGSASDFTASIDWGDGSTTSGSIAANGAGGFKVTGTHTYTEEGSYTVAVAVSDDGGSTTTVMSTAAVADAPLIPAPVTIHPKEGVSFSGVVGNFRDANANGSASDFTSSIDWGDGSTTSGSVASNGAGGFKVTGSHAYGEESSYVVSISVQDDGGSSTTVMSTAAVADAPLIPSPVTIHPKEGVSFSGVVGNFRDANANGSASDFTASIDWGDSTTTSGSIAPNGAGGFKVTGTHSYADEGSYTVSISVQDDGGSTTTVMSTATVADAPLTAIGKTFGAKEGIAFTVVVGNFKDANPHPNLTDFTASINWGDGSTTSGSIASNGAGGFKVTGTHTYTEDGSYTIAVAVSDDGGSTATIMSTAAVADAPLTPSPLTFHAKEGVSFTGVVGNFRDANANGSASDFTASIDWGDGNTTSGTIAANGAGGFKVTGTHTYAEEGPFAVSITVQDLGGSSTVISSTAGVLDAPLTPLPVTLHTKEGISVGGVVGNFRDANPNAAASDFTASIDWGDGTTTTGSIASNKFGGFAVTGPHTYAEEGTFTISITIQDVGGSSTVINSTDVVADAPLSASGKTVQAIIGRSFTAKVASFMDANPTPDMADFSASIAWGDGTTSAGTISANSFGGFNVTGTHTYGSQGTFTATVTITDAGGSTAVVNTTVDVAGGGVPEQPESPAPFSKFPNSQGTDGFLEVHSRILWSVLESWSSTGSIMPLPISHEVGVPTSPSTSALATARTVEQTGAIDRVLEDAGVSDWLWSTLGNDGVGDIPPHGDHG